MEKPKNTYYEVHEHTLSVDNTSIFNRSCFSAIPGLARRAYLFDFVMELFYRGVLYQQLELILGWERKTYFVDVVVVVVVVVFLLLFLLLLLCVHLWTTFFFFFGSPLLLLLLLFRSHNNIKDSWWIQAVDIFFTDFSEKIDWKTKWLYRSLRVMRSSRSIFRFFFFWNTIFIKWCLFLL